MPDQIPPPSVIVIRYDVSCLPEGHRDRHHFTIQVRYCGRDKWQVTDIYGDDYDADGVHAYDRSRPVPLERTRFDHDTALALAQRIAPQMVVNGRTVADVLANGEAHA